MPGSLTSSSMCWPVRPCCLVERSHAGPLLLSDAQSPAEQHLAELESSAWLNDRRFRLMCFTGSSLAFSDLYFHSSSNPVKEHQAAFAHDALGLGFAVTAEETTQRVR